MDEKVRKYGTVGAIAGLGLVAAAQAIGVDTSSLHLPTWADKVLTILGLGFTLIRKKSV